MAHLGPGQVPAVPLHPEAAHQPCPPLHLCAADLLGDPLWLESNQGNKRGIPLLHGLLGHHPQGPALDVHRGRAAAADSLPDEDDDGEVLSPEKPDLMNLEKPGAEKAEVET